MFLRIIYEVGPEAKYRELRRRLRLPWPFVFATKRISLQIPLTVTGRDEHDSVFASGVKLYSRNQPRILHPLLHQVCRTPLLIYPFPESCEMREEIPYCKTLIGGYANV
ncbi:MAG TPA: hypothetical protein VHP35_09585 [Terriglobia bacterium]|nr:hypothetical protein [Terriglobia bacterium]